MITDDHYRFLASISGLVLSTTTLLPCASAFLVASTHFCHEPMVSCNTTFHIHTGSQISMQEKMNKNILKLCHDHVMALIVVMGLVQWAQVFEMLLKIFLKIFYKYLLS